MKKRRKIKIIDLEPKRIIKGSDYPFLERRGLDFAAVADESMMREDNPASEAPADYGG